MNKKQKPWTWTWTKSRNHEHEHEHITMKLWTNSWVHKHSRPRRAHLRFVAWIRQLIRYWYRILSFGTIATRVHKTWTKPSRQPRSGCHSEHTRRHPRFTSVLPNYIRHSTIRGQTILYRSLTDQRDWQILETRANRLRQVHATAPILLTGR